MRRTRRTTGILAAFALLFYIGAVPALTAPETDSVVTGDEPDVVLHVKGLACENCARTMKRGLLEIEGIEDVEAFLEGDQRVHVQMLEGQVVDEETFREVVENCGFVLERVEYKNSDRADE